MQKDIAPAGESEWGALMKYMTASYLSRMERSSEKVDLKEGWSRDRC